MRQTIRNAILGAAILAMSGTVALADPIEGMWKTGDDALVKISNCGGSFCVDVADGKYKGKRSGKLKPDGKGGYSGKLKQFSTGISFTGNATVSGSTIKLIAKKFGMVVKRDTWRKQ